MTDAVNLFDDDDDEVVETETEETEEVETITDEEIEDTETSEESENNTDEVETEEEAEDNTEPEPEPKTDNHIPVAALQEERTKRQEAEAELAKLREQLAANKQPESEESEDTEDTEEAGGLMTRKEAMNLVRNVLAEERQVANQNRMQASQNKALAEYTVEKCGENLDFQSVERMGEGFLTKEDWQEIHQSSDPADTFYHRCIKRTPLLSQLVESKKASKQADVKKVKTAKEPPPLEEIDNGESDDLVDFIYG